VSADVILLDAARDNEYSGDHCGNPLWARLPEIVADQVVLTDETWSGTTYGTCLHALEVMGPALGSTPTRTCSSPRGSARSRRRKAASGPLA